MNLGVKIVATSCGGRIMNPSDSHILTPEPMNIPCYMAKGN